MLDVLLVLFGPDLSRSQGVSGWVIDRVLALRALSLLEPRDQKIMLRATNCAGLILPQLQLGQSRQLVNQVECLESPSLLYLLTCLLR